MKAIRNKNGYAVLVRCGQNHSGNHRLAGDAKWWECCGCRALWSTQEVTHAQDEAMAGRLGGEIGSGGIIPM